MAESVQEKPWRQRIADVKELFGPRNNLYMFDRDARSKFLGNAIGNLQDLVRSRDGNKEKLGRALASVFARTCTYSESYGELDICSALTSKYPLKFCAYCLTESGCTCPVNRDKTKKPQLAPVDEVMASMSVRQLCKVMDDKYGKKNREQSDPLIYAVGRLQQEIYETLNIDIFIQISVQTQEEILSRLELEFADIFAWIFSMSVLLEIDLETELENRYGGTHKRCKKRPCTCGPYQHYATNDRIGGLVEGI